MKILNHLLTIAAVAAAMSFIGCSHDIEMSNPGQGGAEGIPFTFTVESPSSSSAVQAITRSIKSDDVDGTSYDRLRAVWAAGDELSVMLDHDGTYTFSKATITKINSDSTHAAFTTTLDASAAVGDKVTVFYPTLTDKDSLVINYCGNWYNTPQDGTVASLAKLDPIMGSSTLATVSTAGATVAQNIKMDIPETDASNNNSFGSAYYGIKVQKIDSLYQITSHKETDEYGDYTVYDTVFTEAKIVPVKVKKLTLSIQDKDTTHQDNSWYTQARFDPQTNNCHWTRDYFDDSITVVPKDGEATYDRLYMAVPKVDKGLTATFCVQDSDGYVYTCDKIIPAKAGNYYPVTLTMHLAQYVSLGDTTQWATHNVGGKDPEDYGDYFAWGEVQPKNYYSYTYPGYERWYHYKWSSASYDWQESALTKYNSTDEDFILDDDDDAATKNWGSPWRMPYTDEIWRLCNNNMHEQDIIITNRFGIDIKGMKITSRKNGNAIFFPYGGRKYGNKTSARDTQGGYYQGKELYRSGGVGPYGKVPDGTDTEWARNNAFGDWVDDERTSTLKNFGIGGQERYCGLLVRPAWGSTNITHIKKQED